MPAWVELCRERLERRFVDFAELDLFNQRFG